MRHRYVKSGAGPEISKKTNYMKLPVQGKLLDPTAGLKLGHAWSFCSKNKPNLEHPFDINDFVTIKKPGLFQLL